MAEEYDTLNIDEWAMVISGGQEYLARFYDEAIHTSARLALLDPEDPDAKFEFVRASEVFVYQKHTELTHTTQGLAMQSINMVAAPHMTTAPHAFYFSLSGLCFYLLSSLSQEDQRTYLESIREARKRRNQERAQKAGLTIVGPGGLQGGGFAHR